MVRTSVSKKTDAVVTADPLPKSAKIEKARALGKRIIVESVFVAMVKELVDGPEQEMKDVSVPQAPAAQVAAPPQWRAGWYADPTGQPCFRFWDGTAWTHHVVARA